MAAIDLASNHLALEPVLLDRAKIVHGLALIGGAHEFDAALRDPAELPAAFVLYAGTVTAATPAGRVQTPRVIDQVWQIVLLIRPDATSKGGIGNAGQLLARLIAAFEGYQIDGVMDPLEDLTTDEPPIIYDSGLIQFVLTYRARLLLG